MQQSKVDGNLPANDSVPVVWPVEAAKHLLLARKVLTDTYRNILKDPRMRYSDDIGLAIRACKKAQRILQKYATKA